MTLLAFFSILYIIPTVIAFMRNQNNKGAILILNIALGWTFIGWVIALMWACAAKVTRVKIDTLEQ